MVKNSIIRHMLKWILVVMTVLPLLCMCCYGLKVKLHQPLLKIRLGGSSVEDMPAEWIFDDSSNPGSIVDGKGTEIGYIVVNNESNGGLGSTNWKGFYSQEDAIASEILAYENNTKLSEIVSTSDGIKSLGYKISYVAENYRNNYKCIVHLVFPAMDADNEFEKNVKAVWWNYAYNAEYYKLRNLVD